MTWIISTLIFIIALIAWIALIKAELKNGSKRTPLDKGRYY